MRTTGLLTNNPISVLLFIAIFPLVNSYTLLSSVPMYGLRNPRRSVVAATRLYSSRKERKEIQKNMGKISKDLDWEHYEFSQNPKNDHRFNKVDYASGQEIFDIDKETEEDKEVAKKLFKKQKSLFSLSPSNVESATQALEKYINDDRLDRVRTVLGQRTKNCKFLFENPNNPSNVWACLRTIDSFGIQDVDLIIESGMYQGKQALSTKRGMRTAMGSAQWLTLQNHATTAEAIKEIRDVQGYKIYASDLNPNSKDIRDIDWDDGPYCIVMGNEDRGISEEMRNLADTTFTLPMCGFAESFNLSVATSITLAHMSAKSQDGGGPLLPGDMDKHEYNCLYLKGLLHSLPQRRTGKALLKQNNLLEVIEVFETF
jgi:tRNA (guanosine-2'-O-)-methyltransferase